MPVGSFCLESDVIVIGFASKKQQLYHIVFLQKQPCLFFEDCHRGAGDICTYCNCNPNGITAGIISEQTHQITEKGHNGLFTRRLRLDL